MKDHSRRSFVKTSAATGLTFTFAGLIRAHGQSGGGTTWNSEVTFGSTFGTDVSTTWNQEATYVATTWPGNNYSTTYDPNGSYGETTNPYQEYTTTYDPNAYETTQAETEIQTTARTPQVGDEMWFLYVQKDPSTSDMKFPGKYPDTTPNVSMYQETDPYDGGVSHGDGHDGKYKIRKFWSRKTVPYNGGDRFLVTELVGSCYVQANVGSDGVIPDDDLYTTIRVTNGLFRSAVVRESITVSSLLISWSTENIFGKDENIGEDYGLNLKAHKSSLLREATLSIKQDTGDVQYSPSQIAPNTLNDAYEEGSGIDYILAGVGATTPRFVLCMSAGVGPENEVSYKIGFNPNLGVKDTAGVGASLSVEWKESSKFSDNTLQWVIHKAVKKCIAIDSQGQAIWGPAQDGGVAEESNKVSVVGQTLGNPENVR